MFAKNISVDSKLLVFRSEKVFSIFRFHFFVGSNIFDLFVLKIFKRITRRKQKQKNVKERNEKE